VAEAGVAAESLTVDGAMAMEAGVGQWQAKLGVAATRGGSGVPTRRTPGGGHGLTGEGDGRHVKKRERMGSVDFLESARSRSLRNILFSGTTPLLYSPIKRV
jgi:hypothetical protein